MKIFKINNLLSFTGVRQDRNTVSQLGQDNPYDLNLPNSRRISGAIDELSKVKGEDNVNFLLDMSENLRYGTNIDLDGKKSYNDWRAKLNQAAVKAYNLSDKSVQEKLAPKLEKVLTEKRDLSPEEKEILVQRQELLSAVDSDALKSIKNPNMRNLKNNLDYFIISSEVPTSQKLYILKRLNYLMSDEYKINPQLADKKTRVLAEIVNDIVVDTPESKIPNIKMINQRQHGMCAAISVCRKALAYEDKPNYVDMVLSELDDSDYMQVYDRSQLGKHKKIPILKAEIDYDYAMKKGYRIVDTSVMNWMNAADTAGAFNDVLGAYSTFDKENYGTFADTHIFKDIDDNSAKYQDYYRACKKAKDALAACKIDNIKTKYVQHTAHNRDDVSDVSRNRKLVQNIIQQIAPTLSADEARAISNDLQSLRVSYSDSIKKMPPEKREYCYIPNEEDEIKADKLKAYLNSVLPENKNNGLLDSKLSDLLDLTEEIHDGSRSHSKTPAGKYMTNKQIFDAAAAYRTQQVFSLDIPEILYDKMVEYDIPDNETFLIENLHNLSKSIRSKKINPELKEKLIQNFASEINDHSDNHSSRDEILANVLDEYADSVKLMTTSFADSFYRSLLAGDRKMFLSTQLKAVKAEVDSAKNKDIINNTAKILKVKPERKAVSDRLEKYINKLGSENCTDEEYFDILNKCGHKSNLIDIKGVFDNAYELIYNNPNPQYIAGLNLVNGAAADADMAVTGNIYAVLAKSFNNMSMIIKTLQDSLQVTGKDGTILNTADPKYAVLKKMENKGEIPTDKELRDFQNKFDAFARSRSADDGSKVLFKDIPKYLTTFTPFEKEALKKYKSHINLWYSASNRDLTAVYRQMRGPLEELGREVGVQKGEYWVKENDSGLMDNQAVKIFEHMTDRPYYAEGNIRRGIEKIKNSPYSGSSMSSVAHTQPAMHAQYVADVVPVTLKTKDGTILKDAVMHDNTWGVAEHDNIWTDKYGLTRTDYSNDYGGQFGYITNDKYQEGNLAENLIDKKGKYVPHGIPSKEYKKLVPGADSEYSFPMLSDFILQGVSPRAMSTVKSIKQNILLPSMNYVDELTKYAQTMTEDEINSSFKRIETAGSTSRATYTALLKRIKGEDKILDNGIDSLEKYNKLPANDKLKLMCEKVAIIKSYDNIPDINTYHMEVKSPKDIKFLKDKLRKSARDNFDYIIGKNADIMTYGTETSRKDIYKILKQLSDENNLKFDYDRMIKIVNSMKKADKDDFDGSISHTIDIMTKEFEKALKANSGAKLSNEKIKQTSESVRQILEKKFEVKTNDVKTYFNSGRLANFANWVDREFNPQTDEEFAAVLNDLRNMTTAEFKAKYGSTITDTDMGITKYTGYDIVKMIREENDSATNSFINTIFSEAYYKDIEESKIRPYYDLKKFSRNLSSGTYVGGKRSFDDLCSDFYYSLSALTIKKSFDKYKDEAFKKYFAYPAYPLVEISSKESLNDSLDTFYRRITDYMDYVYAYKTQNKTQQSLSQLKQYLDKQNPEKDLTDSQYQKISSSLERVIGWNKEDTTVADKINEAKNLLDSGSKSAGEFSQVINSLYSTFKMYETTADGKTMNEAANITLQNIETFKKTYVTSLFEPKYRGKAFELLNKWISARSKADTLYQNFKSTETENSSELSKTISQKYEKNVQEADKYYNEFRDFFFKHHLYDTPQNLMKEYLLLCAKDAKIKGLPSNSSENAKKELEGMRDVYKDNLKSVLYKADMAELQTLLMDCASNGNLNAVRDAFRTSTLELKNGTVVPLDSDEGLSIIIGPMLAEKNLDTAVLFLNQLGLSEKACDLLMRSNPIKDAEKIYDRIHSILKSSDAQAKFARDEFRELGNIDNNPDYEQVIEDYRQRILKKIDKTNYRGTKKIFNAAIDDALAEIKNHPEVSKTVQLGTNIDMAIDGVNRVVKSNIDMLNQTLQSYQVTRDLILRLMFPENSDMCQKAQNYLDDLNNMLEAQYSKAQSYPNIGIYSS